MDYAGHVMSHAPYGDVWECAASGKLRQLSGSSLSGIGPSASQDVSSISGGASDVTGISSLDSLSEEKTKMFKTYSGLLQIYPLWYELTSGTCLCGDLDVAPSRGEEHDARDTNCLHKETMREDVIEFGDPLASVHAPTQQELKITELVTAYNDCDMDKIARIDEREEERCIWRAYHRNLRK